MKVLSQLIPITIALSTSGADALGWELAGCTAEKFSDIEVSVECDDSSSCSPGDTAVATGTATATALFDNEEVTLNVCFMSGMYCPKKAEIGAGTLCDNWLTPTDGQECGAEGGYDVSYEQMIPDQSKIPKKLAQYLSSVVTIQTSLGDGDDCSSSSGYQLAYGMTGLVSVALVGAALMKKKGKDVETDNSFVQMGDRAAIV